MRVSSRASRSPGKYRQVWRTFGARELIGIIQGVATGFGLSAVLILYLYSFEGFSRAVFAIDAVVLVFLLVGSRVAISSADEYLRRRRGAGQPILIYGAGVGGAFLVSVLLEDRLHALLPQGFIDDDPAKRRLRLEGVPVVGTFDDLDAHTLEGTDHRSDRQHRRSSTGCAWPRRPRSAAPTA